MSIQGYAESIQKNIGDNHRQSAGIILEESYKMKDLVDYILTLSRIETGTETVDKEEFDIREMIDSCISSIINKAIKNILKLNAIFQSL